MDFMKESAKLRKEIEKINIVLNDGTALSEEKRADLKHQRSVLEKQFKALLR